MYEIRKSMRILSDGTQITTYTREVASANILSVEAGTTGYMGGDSGHGGRTYFRIHNEGGTDMKVNAYDDLFGCAGFEVTLGGDTELATIIEALKFIVKALEDEKGE